MVASSSRRRPRPPGRASRPAGDGPERMESEAPEFAAELHRWFARLLAQRLTDTLGAVDALLE